MRDTVIKKKKIIRTVVIELLSKCIIWVTEIKGLKRGLIICYGSIGFVR